MILDESMVPSFNRGKPRFMAFLKLILEQLDASGDIFEKLYSYFDIDDATGEQLDILGSLLATSRYLSFTPTSTGNRELSDDDYRMVLRQKIAACVWDGSMEGLQKLCSTIYPTFGTVIVDNMDGSITYNITNASTMTDLQREMVSKRIVYPAPAGIKTNTVVTEKENSYALNVSGGILTEENASFSAEE